MTQEKESNFVDFIFFSRICQHFKMNASAIKKRLSVPVKALWRMVVTTMALGKEYTG